MENIFENNQKDGSKENIQLYEKSTSIMFHFFGGVVFPLLAFALLVLFSLSGSDGGTVVLLFAWFGLPIMAFIICISSIVGICSAIALKKFSLASVPSFFALVLIIPLISLPLSMLGITKSFIVIEYPIWTKIFLVSYALYAISSTIMVGILMVKKNPINEI